MFQFFQHLASRLQSWKSKWKRHHSRARRPLTLGRKITSPRWTSRETTTNSWPKNHKSQVDVARDDHQTLGQKNTSPRWISRQTTTKYLAVFRHLWFFLDFPRARWPPSTWSFSDTCHFFSTLLAQDDLQGLCRKKNGNFSDTTCVIFLTPLEIFIGASSFISPTKNLENENVTQDDHQGLGQIKKAESTPKSQLCLWVKFEPVFSIWTTCLTDKTNHPVKRAESQ